MFFYFDSCSNYSIAPANKFPDAKGEKKEFSWVNPNLQIRSIGTTRIKLKFNDAKEREWNFHVLEGITLALIGMDFMTHYKISLCIPRKEVKFEENDHITKGGSVITNDDYGTREGNMIYIAQEPRLEDLFKDDPRSPPKGNKMSHEMPELSDLESTEDEESFEEGEVSRHKRKTTKEKLTEKIKELDGIPSEIKQMLLRHVEAFDTEEVMKRTVPDVEWDLELLDETPMYHAPRNVPIKYERKFRRILRRYVKLGIISPTGASEFLQPCHVVPKPSSGVRMCLDLRQLNERSKTKKHAIPKVNDLVDRVAQNRPSYMTQIDLSDAFYSI